MSGAEQLIVHLVEQVGYALLTVLFVGVLVVVGCVAKKMR